MPEYRRSFIPGGTYFYTLVTYHRAPILTSTASRDFLREAWLNVQDRYPFTTLAVCLLPDHLHAIWALPEGDQDYSLRWREIKRIFTLRYLKSIGPDEPRNVSRLKRGEAAIWQRRFWEHTIRDEADLNRHIDYIHYNPVKHGLVGRAIGLGPALAVTSNPGDMSLIGDRPMTPSTSILEGWNNLAAVSPSSANGASSSPSGVPGASDAPYLNLHFRDDEAGESI